MTKRKHEKSDISAVPVRPEELKTRKLAENPFLLRPEHPAVYVAAGQSPYENTRSALSRINLSGLQGKKVLLKPNAGRIALPGEGITTDPQVVAAAIDLFLEAGALVALGESPITGVKALEALESCGIAAVAGRRNCRIIDLDAHPGVAVALPEGRAIEGITVCPEVFEFDYVVSLPVVKVHMHTGVTLSVKNMKGCLWRRSKVDLHMLPLVEGHPERPLDIAIADMAKVLNPHLAVIDGMVGMEGMGPSAGQAKPLGAVVVSAAAFAADAVACALMGLEAENVSHLRLGAARGYGIIDLEKMDIQPGNWPDYVKPFKPPPENLSIEFPGINILDENSCSACQSTLLLFLKRYGDRVFDYFPKDKPIHIAIGKGHEYVPPGAICIGNCTIDHRDQGIFVKGCPPVGSAIFRAITKGAGEQEKE